LKIRVFRLSYPKPAEISYERGNIPFEEVYQAVYEILVNENQTARKIAGMIGSQIWEEIGQLIAKKSIRQKEK